MTESVDDRILLLISQLTTMEADELEPAHRLREDLGMDSVSSMELLSMLAEEFDLDIEMEEAIDVQTVGGILEMAHRHLNG